MVRGASAVSPGTRSRERPRRVACGRSGHPECFSRGFSSQTPFIWVGGGGCEARRRLLFLSTCRPALYGRGAAFFLWDATAGQAAEAHELAVRATQVDGAKEVLANLDAGLSAAQSKELLRRKMVVKTKLTTYSITKGAKSFTQMRKRRKPNLG